MNFTAYQAHNTLYISIHFIFKGFFIVSVFHLKFDELSEKFLGAVCTGAFPPRSKAKFATQQNGRGCTFYLAQASQCIYRGVPEIIQGAVKPIFHVSNFFTSVTFF